MSGVEIGVEDRDGVGVGALLSDRSITPCRSPTHLICNRRRKKRATFGTTVSFRQWLNTVAPDIKPITMVAILELSILVLAIIAAIILYKILKTVKRMVVNTIIGLVVLFLANVVLGLGIAYDWLVIAICAVGGIVGAILIIVLHSLGIAFLG